MHIKLHYDEFISFVTLIFWVFEMLCKVYIKVVHQDHCRYVRFT